ncbi:MAG: sugar phosphate isomerase/epimerase [Chloroflexi bacterium]|nr:sugar phosphate isomerase/epimerase [Chloroflexota bacterium]
MTAQFTLSAFGDEIAEDVDEQLRVLYDLHIGYLELRSAWETNVLELTDEEVVRLIERCDAHSIRVSCIGSPIGKSQIDGPIEKVVDDLGRITDIAKMVGTDRVRVFSFYPESDGLQAERVEESITRLRVMAEVAVERNVVLLLENEGGLVGDTPERCRALVEGVNSPNLRYVWDTGNYPQMGFARSVDIGWPLLAEYTECVQVKDCRITEGTITVAGEGDGQVRELLHNLRDAGYVGFLALEPHLLVAGQRGGFSGAEGMKMAADALRRLMAETGCVEARA